MTPLSLVKDLAPFSSKRTKTKAVPDDNPPEDGSQRRFICDLNPESAFVPVNAPAAPPTPTSTSSGPQRRFIGDLNPEAVFVPVSGKTPATNQPYRDNRDTGFWTATPGGSSAPSPRSNYANISPAYLKYLESIQAFSLPSKQTQNSLIAVYINGIHPLLPILDVPAFLDEYAKSTVSLPLLLGVILVTAKHADTAHLIPEEMTVRTWASGTADKIVALIQGVSGNQSRRKSYGC